MVEASTYCSSFPSENIGYLKPTKGEYEICFSFRNHLSTPDHNLGDCDQCLRLKEEQSQARIE